MRDDTKDVIDNYVEHGLRPGGFIEACLANDLLGAFGRADEGNRTSLFEIVSYIYETVPISAMGSCEAVEAWIEKKMKERTK